MIFCIKFKFSLSLWYIVQKKRGQNGVSPLSTVYYCFFIFGFAIKEARYPKNIAAAIPPADAFTPPINAPSKPEFWASVIAPLAKLAPKPSSGTVAPQPAKSITYWYMPDST